MRLLATAANRIAYTKFEIAKFNPPENFMDQKSLSEDLCLSVIRVVREMFACVSQGWESPAWLSVKSHALTSDTLANQLRIIISSPVNENEDVYERVLGLSGDEFRKGDPVAGWARLGAAWARDQENLDKRLRHQMRHLIVDSLLPITVKLRQHLVALATANRPLIAHHSAILARDFITDKLREDLDHTRIVIGRHVKTVPLMLSAHRGKKNSWKMYIEAAHPEDQVRPLLDLYKIVSEGDVKRTAIVVLELLGRTVPTTVTLATVKDLLSAEGNAPMCEMLAALIRPEWRNAIAHEDFLWDSEKSMAILDGKLVSLGELLHTSIAAMNICEGFEHGVAVSYAQNSKLNPWDETVSTSLDGLTRVLQTMGNVGQPVLDGRKRGPCIRLDVPDISIESIQTLLRAILMAAQVDNSIDLWEVRQGPDRPILNIDRFAIEAALKVASGLWESTDPTPFASLPLIANGMRNAGEDDTVSAGTILALAAAHVTGERSRLTPSLASADPAAKNEMLTTVRLISDGVNVASTFLEGDRPKRKLLMFAQILSGDCQWHENAPPSALISGFSPADRALNRNMPAHIPWIMPSAGR
ncbi:hypothetical protein [Planomonospora venezuelensis]|uniref:Uncharacterized protein n=1 Tax=Planomonospora venezuelensis TaxID=1999 RepID=A0A841D7K6_PLAVE|nr:hypothetical protein [Planomonospora venezuelensis]MBB5966612.1 hypothetical protein [Planomonospora venezuelensis]